jgi:flagellar export protein FliJ
MAFRFSLDPLLRFRRSLEHQEQERLAKASARVAEVEMQVEELSSALGNFAEREAGQMQSGMTGAEIQFDLLCRSAMLRRREELQTELVCREELRAVCREALQKARRERETLDSLREQQLNTYLQEEKRREQRRMDDTFLLRRSFGRRQ